MAKDPAILFYTSDFIAGTLTMTDAQRGKYIILLCLQHQKGYLSEKDMLNICKTYDEDIWLKFREEDGKFYNERMLLETQKRSRYSESRSKNRKGTYDKDMLTYDEHMENENIIINRIEDKDEKIKKREIIFKSEVFEFLEKYNEVMLNKFCNYWTEKNKSGTKMRFELEKVFEINRRLATWASRDKDIEKKNKSNILYTSDNDEKQRYTR